MPASADRPSADQYLQRAELLADLGRYEDAAGELGDLVAAEPHHVRGLTTLTRVRLAAGQPAEALVAADAAVAAAPDDLAALAARGMVLADLDRLTDAAETAERILRLGPDDSYAQTSGAAILAEVRNGQAALDAAWRGVQLNPQEATAHLVLGLVSARMRLFDLAERAYREALRLDPQLAEARHDVGIVRLEQRRYAEALEQIAEGIALDLPGVAGGQAGDAAPTGGPRSGDAPAGGHPAGGHPAGGHPAGGHPAGGHPAGGRAASQGLSQLLHIGTGYAFIAPIVAACVGTGAVLWRVTAVMLAFFGFVGLGVFLTRLPGRVSEVLPALLRADARLAVAVGAVAAAPCLMLLYALTGSPWTLAATIAAGAVVLLSTLVGGRER